MTLRTSTARPSSTSGAVVEPSWKNLLPELLLALLGCSGGAFVYEAVDIDVRDVVASDVGRAGSAPALKDSRLVLSDLVDWVSDAEREQLNRLVRLGRYYSWLVEYAMELTGVAVAGPSSSSSRGGRRLGMQQSPYHVAVAQGCLEVLDVYRQAVLNVEARVVEAGSGVGWGLWSLLPLEEALSEFAELFPFLCDQIERIEAVRRKQEQGSDRGGEGRAPSAIEVFEGAARSGIPVVEGCSLRIAWHCYQVLFKQMHAWMVHGRLVDPTGEFFIRVEDGRRGGKGRERLRLRLRVMDADVVEGRLPGTISLPFAKDVLYVGQCTRILESLEVLGPVGVGGINRDKHRGGGGGGGTTTAATATPRDAGSEDARSDADFEEALKEIWMSPPERLDWIALRNLVRARKLELSDRVWVEMHHSDRNLAGHIDEFVDVVLQNNGSLYAELVRAVAGVASEDPDPERAAALAAHLYREAAYCDGMGSVDARQHSNYMGEAGDTRDARDGKSPPVVTMTWYDARRTDDLVRSIVPIWHPDYDQGIWIPPYDAWDGLCIRYDMKWPMDLVFPVKAMRVYGALWQLMFRLSRALDDMKRIRVLMARKGKTAGKGGTAASGADQAVASAARQTTALHHRLYHFLATYAMFLQEEIVARSKAKINGILASSTSLIEAEAKHMEFISDIVGTSCIDVKQVMGVLENMFVCVKSLGKLVAGQPSVDLEDVCELFLSKYNVWYQLLQSNPLQTGKRGESIRRLLLKMNYNGFMDSNAARQVDRNALHLTE